MSAKCNVASGEVKPATRILTAVVNGIVVRIDANLALLEVVWDAPIWMDGATETTTAVVTCVAKAVGVDVLETPAAAEVWVVCASIIRIAARSMFVTVEANVVMEE